MLENNAECKRFVLGIALDLPRAGAESGNLLSHSIALLGECSQGGHAPETVVVRVGLARLLCLWLYESVDSVASFLTLATNLPFVRVISQPCIALCVNELGTNLPYLICIS